MGESLLTEVILCEFLEYIRCNLLNILTLVVAYSGEGQKTLAIQDLVKTVQLDQNDKWANDNLRSIRE
ncbi:hypothetical protein AGMMS49587_04830 [Spirochaetia bacterium]|nr:hypothetical protein AGMMS49587_04830 [Spirochaetia bacterium]